MKDKNGKRLTDLATLTNIYLKKKDFRHLEFIKMTFNNIMDEIIKEVPKK